jgi:hypothetical protein
MQLIFLFLQVSGSKIITPSSLNISTASERLFVNRIGLTLTELKNM